MLISGYFKWIFFSLLGVIAANVRTLPHVIKYQTAIPQRLKNFPLVDDPVTRTKYPDALKYSVSIDGKNYTLHLEKNKDLVGKNFTVTLYSDEGPQVSTTPDSDVHCYYHGQIVGVEESSASIALCSGIKGFVTLHDQMYLIEPLASKEGGHEVPSDEGLHAVYNYKHLRRKRSSCSHGNTANFYDHETSLSGLFQLGSLKSRAQIKDHLRKPRTVELVVVVDNKEYKKFGSKKAIETRVLEIVNHVDKLYRPVGIRVMLVDLNIWYSDQIQVSTNPDLTLDLFLKWRQQHLLPRVKHDNAQFITGVDFDGDTVGLAKLNAMCTSNSGAVNQDHNTNSIGVASTIAHEMGHNLGLSHDTKNCVCGSDTSTNGCIMAERISSVYPKEFSRCSQQQLSSFLEEFNPSCLLDTPSTKRIYGGPVCGNGFLELGEECDCGTVKECKNPCCNATTCKLNAGAQCAEGECCHNCKLKPTGSVCRPKAGDCDLTEYCTGFSAACPNDAFTQNGLPCNRGKGYCYNGQCPSRQEHCRKLWGSDAEVAADACFYLHGSCTKRMYSQRCPGRDQSCGTLFCSGGREFPVTSRKSFYKVGNGVICNEATMNPEDNYPSDLGMVPTGTKCGNNMVCYNKQCEDIKNIKEYGTNDCSSKCSKHGVCNHQGKCHCDPGWAPPFCDVQLSELAEESGLVVLIASLVVTVLLLLVLIFGCLMCRKRQPKMKFRSLASSGQSNLLFQSSSAHNSPHLGSTHISQPTFLESSSTQACKPLFTAIAVKPQAGALKPCRTAPEPPKKTPCVPQSAKSHQSPAVSRLPFYTESKPSPPSRPLPPLATKPIMKPKPPVPPVKTKPSTVVSSLPHTQLPGGRIALIPPSRPR